MVGIFALLVAWSLLVGQVKQRCEADIIADQDGVAWLEQHIDMAPDSDNDEDSDGEAVHFTDGENSGGEAVYTFDYYRRECSFCLCYTIY